MNGLEWMRDPYKYRVVDLLRKMGGEARFRDFKRNLDGLNMSEKKLATTLKELCLSDVLKIDWRDDLTKKLKYYVLPSRLININKELEGLLKEVDDLINNTNLREEQKVEGLSSLIKRLIQKVEYCLYGAFRRGLDSKNYNEAIKKIPWSLLVIENWSCEMLKMLWKDTEISSKALNRLRDYQYCI